MPGDGHELCVICLGAEHALSALKRVGRIHCGDFSLRKLQLYLTTSSISAFAEPACRLRSWESQTDLVEEREGVPLTFLAGSIVFVPEAKAH